MKMSKLTYVTEIDLKRLPKSDLEWVLDRLNRTTAPFCLVILEEHDDGELSLYDVYERDKNELEAESSHWASWYRKPEYFRKLFSEELEGRGETLI